MFEIGIQDLLFQCFAFILIQAASNKISHIFHAAAPAHILKVNGSNITLLGKTEIGQLGISVNKSLKSTGSEFLIDQGSSPFQAFIIQSIELLRTGFQMPVCALVP